MRGGLWGAERPFEAPQEVSQVPCMRMQAAPH
jgi:hypothetical protein